MKALVTGAGGLIGAECVKFFSVREFEVIGIDNDMRRQFFGINGSTRPIVDYLENSIKSFHNFDIDIRDRSAIRSLMEKERPNVIIHTAAQPSHDKAASVPYEDFDVNAVGTINLLVAARDFCRESPFCFTSTNKVYGDRPNTLPLTETETRFDFADLPAGIDETMSVDACLHSLFGASKLAADILCQEFGRYFDMPIGIFRCGCLTGALHAAVELHGYLSYIVHCAAFKKKYTIFGYKGKQVRDQLDASDVASLFYAFAKSPTRGEVYNLGGGRPNSLSILETIDRLEALGHELEYDIAPTARIGDHICYISDIAKVQKHFPDWRVEVSVDQCIERILEAQLSRRQLEAAE